MQKQTFVNMGRDLVVRVMPVDPRDQQWQSDSPAYRVTSGNSPARVSGQYGSRKNGRCASWRVLPRALSCRRGLAAGSSPPWSVLLGAPGRGSDGAPAAVATERDSLQARVSAASALTARSRCWPVIGSVSMLCTASWPCRPLVIVSVVPWLGRLSVPSVR
jgi:hypothetical protein